MKPLTRDALERAARLAKLELAADALSARTVRRLDVRALLAAALALLFSLYPGMSAAAVALIGI